MLCIGVRCYLRIISQFICRVDIGKFILFSYSKINIYQTRSTNTIHVENAIIMLMIYNKLYNII